MNEHSKKFPDVKSYYDFGIWRSTTVKKAVKKGWIAPPNTKKLPANPTPHKAAGRGKWKFS